MVVRKVLFMKNFTLLVTVLFICAVTRTAHAQGTGAGKVDLTFTQPTGITSSPNVPPNAIAVLTNGQVLIGGGFSQPLNRWGLARLNADGTPDDTFTTDVQRQNIFGSPGQVGTINRILPRPDGRFFLHGNFTYVNRMPGYTNLAVIDANGNHDTNFIPTNLGSDISTARIAVTPDNRLLLNLYSNLVQRIGTNGAVEASFILTNIVNVSSLMSAPDGGFFVGTTKSFLPAVDATVARFHSDGTPDASFNAPSFEYAPGDTPFTLGLPVVQPDGKPIVLGFFTLVGGVQRGGIARLNLDGSLDTTFVPGTGGIGTIYQSAGLIGLTDVALLPDGRMVIWRDGVFRYNNAFRYGIGRISSIGALDAGFTSGTGPEAVADDPYSDGWGIRTVAAGPNGEIYVGGSFTNFNKTGRHYIVRLNSGPVSAGPTIVSAPASQSVTNGVDVTFTVVATGPGPFTYSWKHNGKTIAGATSATLTVTNVDLQDVGAYIVTVQNSAGGSTAAPAILTVNGVSVPDFSGPGFKITSPAGTFVLATSNEFTFNGTAKDNQGLASLSYRQDSNSWVQIALSSNWTFNVTLHPGTNVFLFTAADTSGNLAATQRVVAFYVVTQAIDLKITGGGTVTGATNGQGFAIGRNYPLKATPSSGNLFSNWIADGVVFTNPVLSYFMWSNATVCANLVTNPFIALQGSYSGLFYDTNDPLHETSGSFTFKLTTAGAYSGKLIHAGVAYSGSGQFGLNLRSQKIISRKAPLTPLTVDLQLIPNSDQILGTVTDGSWTSELFGYRATFASANPATNAVGKYTLLLSGNADPQDGPLGQGFSTATISLVGAVQFKGALAENTALSYKAALASNGQCAVYLPLYKNGGSLIGWLTFGDTATNDIRGPLLWTKPSGVTGPLYSGGFTGQVTALGSRYAMPAAGSRAINVPAGVALLAGGNLPDVSTNTVTLDTANKIAVTSTNLPKLAFKITTSSGLLGGSFIHPATLKNSAIKGVLLQKQNSGGGFFPGTNETGLIYFGLPENFPLFE